MICAQDRLQRRLGEIDGRVQTTGGVCLNGGKFGQMDFQTKADLQNQAIGWLLSWRWNGGTISTNLDGIWGMSAYTAWTLRRHWAP